ncbi:MAG: chemotaxis protein CheX [Spirochaetales bacterium]|nr:chemotaxis protein CheX [Spirochaetales bacterium]
MDKELIKPFLQYTISMFKEMYNFTPIYSKAHKVTDLSTHKWDISGVVGILGNYEGIFAIRLKRSLAFKLLNQANLISENPDEIIQMISGMISEFANIVCGNALNKIDPNNGKITVPLTIQGTNHTISWPLKGPVIAIPFTTPYGDFEIQLNFSS